MSPLTLSPPNVHHNDVLPASAMSTPAAAAALLAPKSPPATRRGTDPLLPLDEGGPDEGASRTGAATEDEHRRGHPGRDRPRPCTRWLGGGGASPFALGSSASTITSVMSWTADSSSGSSPSMASSPGKGSSSGGGGGGGGGRRGSLRRRCISAVQIRRGSGRGRKSGAESPSSMNAAWSADGNIAFADPDLSGSRAVRARRSIVKRFAFRSSSNPDSLEKGLTVVVSGSGSVGVALTLKSSDSLSKARIKLRKEFGDRSSGDVLPNAFRFVGAGEGLPAAVPEAIESSMTVSRCSTSDRRIVLQAADGGREFGGGAERPALLSPTEESVADLNPKARAVYLLCLRILHQFERKESRRPSPAGDAAASAAASRGGAGALRASSSSGGPAGRLTPDVRTALAFVEALARLSSMAGARAPWAEHPDWSRIESGLFWVEDAVRAAVRRAGTSRLAAWWSERSDRSELREAVGCVRDLVRVLSSRSFGSAADFESPSRLAPTAGGQGGGGGDDGDDDDDDGDSRSQAARAADAVLSVEFDRPSAESEALREKMGKVRLRELKNPKHDELRREIAGHLDMNEAELMWEVQHRRLSEGGEAGDEQSEPPSSASGGPISRRHSSRNLFNKRASLIAEMTKAGERDENLEECLAPLQYLEEGLIDDHVGRFEDCTGQWAMDSFDNWVEEKGGKHRLYILAAGAGFGKSAIASKIIRERDDAVVAHYFCRHEDRRSSSAKAMVLSIAFQLAQRFPQYSRRITNILAKHNLTRSKLMGTKCNLSTIFTELIEIPLHSMKVSEYTKHVIVIDGLDECHTSLAASDSTGRLSSTCVRERRNSDPGGKDRPEILEAIQHYFPRVPSWLKIYITTRPILPVLTRLKRFNAHMMGPDENHAMDDMRVFFAALLQRAGVGAGEDEQWASDAVDMLLSKSRGLFLYASIVADKVLRHSQGAHGRDAVRRAVDSLPGGMDNLLRRELFVDDGPSSDQDEDDDADSLQWQVVRLCIAATEPLHLETLETLTGCDGSRLNDMLERSMAFFKVKNDCVYFRHNLVKDWLVRECSAGSSGGGACPNANRRKPSLRRRSTSELLNQVGNGGGPPQWKLTGTERCASFMATKCLSVLEDGTFFRPDLNETNDLDDTRRYILDHTVTHLVEAKMRDRARSLLLDVRWLMSRSTDGEGLVRDCDALSEGDRAVQLLRRAVQLALPAMRADPRQLAGQLVGRLFDSAAEGRGDDDVRRDVRALLDGLEANDAGFSWWCPVSPTWEKAELDFIQKLDGHDSAVQTVAWDGSGERIASGMWDGRAVIWDALLGKADKILVGHREAVWSVAWSPCGSRLASSSLDQTIRVWNAELGLCEQVLEGHTDHVWSVAWSSDSRRLASGSRDERIRIWNAGSGECEQILGGNGGGVYSVAWEESGERIVSGGTDNYIYVWNADSGDCESVLRGHTDWVRSVVWSYDKILSGSADRSVRIWDAATGECQQVLHGHTDSVWSVATSKDGRHIVSGSTDKTVRVWDTSVGRCEHVLNGHKGSVWSVSYSADGKKVASGSADTTITIWDAAPGESEPALTGHGASVWSVDLSKDGKCLVSGSSDKTVRVWSTVTGSCTRAFTGQGGPVWSVALSNDARRVVSGSTDGTVNIHNISTGDRELVLSGHTGKIWCVVWSNGCSKVISGSQDKSLKIWDAATGNCVKTLSGHEGDVRAISLSPDGKRVASGSSDKTIRVWRLSSGTCEHVMSGLKSGILSVSWSPDGKYLAAGSSEKVAQVFNMRTFESETVLTGHSRRINSVTWSPDGQKVATGSTDKTIRVWNIKTGECQLVITGHTGLGVYSVSWSKDGERLVSGGTDKTVRVWSASLGRCEHVLTGHTGLGVYSVAWSEDGRRLVSGSRDRTVQIWDTDNGECLQVLRGHTNWVYSVAWEKGGKRIASISDDSTCRIWDAVSGECLQVLENTRELPSDFDTASTSCITRDFSGRSNGDEPVGIQCDKVQVFNGRACAWMGKSVNFFKLIKENSAGI